MPHTSEQRAFLGISIMPSKNSSIRSLIWGLGRYLMSYNTVLPILFNPNMISSTHSFVSMSRP